MKFEKIKELDIELASAIESVLSIIQDLELPELMQRLAMDDVYKGYLIAKAGMCMGVHSDEDQEIH